QPACLDHLRHRAQRQAIGHLPKLTRARDLSRSTRRNATLARSIQELSIDYFFNDCCKITNVKLQENLVQSYNSNRKGGNLPYKTAGRHLVSALLLCLSTCAAFGQEEPGDSTAPAQLNIRLDAYGGAIVELKIFDRSLPSSLAPAVSQVLG